MNVTIMSKPGSGDPAPTLNIELPDGGELVSPVTLVDIYECVEFCERKGMDRGELEKLIGAEILSSNQLPADVVALGRILA
jgi:hypothetical protein